VEWKNEVRLTGHRSQSEAHASLRTDYRLWPHELHAIAGKQAQSSQAMLQVPLWVGKMCMAGKKAPDIDAPEEEHQMHQILVHGCLARTCWSAAAQ
jgi:hypothetical protein